METNFTVTHSISAQFMRTTSVISVHLNCKAWREIKVILRGPEKAGHYEVKTGNWAKTRTEGYDGFIHVLWGIGVQFPAETTDFSLVHHARRALRTTQTRIQQIPGALLSGGKQSRHEADHSLHLMLRFKCMEPHLISPIHLNGLVINYAQGVCRISGFISSPTSGSKE